MATLNQIAERVLQKLNQVGNISLREQIKFDIRNLGAKLIRQDAERNFLSSEYSQNLAIEMIKVNSLPSCTINLNCFIYRSKHILPKPIRRKVDEPFNFIGALDSNNKFTWVKADELEFYSHFKNVEKEIKYDYINGHIYVWNVKRLLKEILIRDVWIDTVNKGDNCLSDSCFKDNEEFPLPEDMIFDIISILQNKEVQQDKQVNIDGKD